MRYSSISAGLRECEEFVQLMVYVTMMPVPTRILLYCMTFFRENKTNGRELRQRIVLPQKALLLLRWKLTLHVLKTAVKRWLG